MPTTRKTAPANETEADELRMHLDNTRRLYEMKRYTERAMLKKVKAGKYNHALAPKAFLYVAAEAARDYRKEYGMTGGFNPATRMLAAKDMVSDFEGEQEFIEAKSARKANPSHKRTAKPARSKRKAPKRTAAQRSASARKGARTRARTAR